MRTLSGIPYTNAPGGDYPYGRIRNKDNTTIPPIVGTPVIEQLYGDMIQFFQRLAFLGGITINELPDNTNDGFQTVESLFASILAQFRASDGLTQAGVSTELFVTPGSLSSRTATETRTGIIEIATNAEVQTGSDTTRAVTPSGLESKTATETRKGIAEIATNLEVLAGTDTERMVTPASLAFKVGELHTQYFAIGDWNMDANVSIDVPIGGLTMANIREVSCLIRNDDNTLMYPLDTISGGTGNVMGSIGDINIAAENITLIRVNAGLFDSINFDSTSYNRGWVIVRYLP